MTPIKKFLSFLINNRWQDNLLIVLSLLMVAQFSMTSRIYSNERNKRAAIRGHKERVIRDTQKNKGTKNARSDAEKASGKQAKKSN